MGDVGGTAQAAADVAVATIEAASNIVSWGFASAMPHLQALANKEVLELQKEQYDALTKKQRDIINAAINQYLNSIDNILESEQFEKAFPDVPEAAEYVPVVAGEVQAQAIADNVAAISATEDYVGYVNNLNIQQALTAALATDPRFLVTLDIQSKAVQDLTRGLLPIGDVVEVLSDSAEQACLTGRIGSTGKTTARDLGISKLRAQAAGRKEFREMTTWSASSVVNQNRIHDASEMMMSPATQLQLALTQSQLIQQSLQNKNNQLAQKAPYLMAELQVKLQKIITRLQAKSSEALLQNTYQPNVGLTSQIMPTMENISKLAPKIGDAVTPALKSFFMGERPKSQDGYDGGRTGSAKGDITEGAPKATIVPE